MSIPQLVGFDEVKVMEHLRHYLPTQAPLKDFIHHNTLHAFQGDHFHTALHAASRNFGYKTYLNPGEYIIHYHSGRITHSALERSIRREFPGVDVTDVMEQMLRPAPGFAWTSEIGRLRARWKTDFHISMDKEVHPTLFRLLGTYLDQGISSWKMGIPADGFLAWVRALEEKSRISLFRRKEIRNLLFDQDLTIADLLSGLVEDALYYDRYLFDQQFSHPGWSGMVSVLETQPQSLMDRRPVCLHDFILVELLFESDALKSKRKSGKLSGKNLPPFLPMEVQDEEAFRYLRVWQEAFEWSYYNGVLLALKTSGEWSSPSFRKPEFQAVFCIDDRECSLRRHLEFLEPECRTYSTAGFFNLDFYFRPENSLHSTKVCPAPVTPNVMVKEFESDKRLHSDLHFHSHTHGVVGGWILSQTIGFWSALKLAGGIFRPSPTSQMVSSFHHMDEKGQLQFLRHAQESEDGMPIGFTVQELLEKLASLLTSIGLTSEFGRFVYLVGHGASSMNNTHYAGYDCGACSGRPGSANARVAAKALNMQEIRDGLRGKGIDIPADTFFVAALHDTTRDEVRFYDTDQFTEEATLLHQRHAGIFREALMTNAGERARRFDWIDIQDTPERIHRKVKERSVSLFEPRPEWNHATNTLCIVGRRERSAKVFLDRRSFLQSYDHSIDPEGTLLTAILGAVTPVCGGINLEYYFSTVDAYRLGAGSKLPHNVVGLIGVSNGMDGDLRTGLPSQMVNIHEAVRLMMIIEQEPEIVLRALERNESVKEWYDQEWIHLMVIHPEKNQWYRYDHGNFEVFEPYEERIPVVRSWQELIRNKGNIQPHILNIHGV